MKMEATTYSSETSVGFQRTTRRYIRGQRSSIRHAGFHILTVDTVEQKEAEDGTVRCAETSVNYRLHGGTKQTILLILSGIRTSNPERHPHNPPWVTRTQAAATPPAKRSSN
jgi:hypothetical protein